MGDGLVSQIPALIVSTAAGMVVTKAGVAGTADVALFKQLGGQPKAMGLVCFLLLALAILPGIPALPFLTLAAFAGGAAYWVNYRDAALEEEAVKQLEEEAIDPKALAEEPISSVWNWATVCWR